MSGIGLMVSIIGILEGTVDVFSAMKYTHTHTHSFGLTMLRQSSNQRCTCLLGTNTEAPFGKSHLPVTAKKDLLLCLHDSGS